MRDRDSLILESLYSFILEGKKETIDYLQKNDADQDTITFFTRQDNKGKPLFPTDHAVVLYNWIKDNPVKLDDIEKDYMDFRKYFPNKNLKDFRDYMDFSEQVHAKAGEKSFAERNKEESGDIDVHGVDKENVIADDEDVLILRGDDEHKCVKYGKGYSFCISRPYGGNMYGNYRLSKESTFYFVYFKKIPKENPKHIMVLDRTRDGWEWTFGENSTQVIEGGWDEVVESFPELEKYEDDFINKELTDEEKEYQKKLAKFVDDPRKEKFEEFSYKEKADVLKFGMKIPEDLFDSLDKFLRNEYISVGPNIDLYTFNKLNDKEKERYIKVRKTIINQQEPETSLDVEIVKNDPKLYEKYIKPEENDYNQFIKRYGDLEHYDDESLSLNLKYFPLNLPQLQTSGDIDAYNVKEINLPKLQKSGYITAFSATKINLPQLQISGGITANNATELKLPQLREGRHIEANNVTELNLPQLQTSDDIVAFEATQLNLPQLQTSRHIRADKATVINLPQLRECGHIIAYSATKINLPQLQISGGIDASSAKKIIIPKKFVSMLRYVPKDCQIIHPEDNQVNESRTPKFKEFVANKYF
jgi:hypothetical protein